MTTPEPPDFIHECKSFEGEDEKTTVIECVCGWGLTLEGWGGKDENGKWISRESTDFVESFSNAHKLFHLDWPYETEPPDTWPGSWSGKESS